MEFCLLRERGEGYIRRQTLLRNLKFICQQALNWQYQPGWNTNQNEIKNICSLYIEYQVLKVPLAITYKIEPPSLFISYLLLYVVGFNGFTQMSSLMIH